MVRIAVGFSKPAQDLIADPAATGPGGAPANEAVVTSGQPGVFCQILNPDDFVHSRTDQRELQSLRHTDISIEQNVCGVWSASLL